MCSGPFIDAHARACSRLALPAPRSLKDYHNHLHSLLLQAARPPRPRRLLRGKDLLSRRVFSWSVQQDTGKFLNRGMAHFPARPLPGGLRPPS